MFYKIKALYEAGGKIILHYFDYKPFRNTKEIAPFCSAIYAYKRKNLFQSLPLSRPFVVASRINEDLIHRLNEDRHPVLLEGLHVSGIVPFLHKGERVVLRMHNDEASYYHHLAKTELSLLKRMYFIQESRLLQTYQKKFEKAIRLACLSETDQQALREKYGFYNLSFIPAFLPWQKVESKAGKGDYCLYHGNLSVSENSKAAQWLIQNVFSQLPIPFVIAGKEIPKTLFEQAKKHQQITFVNNPPEDEMEALIKDAHIHVLPSVNSTGVKLKLLHALFKGRYCVTNDNGAKGTGISRGIVVKNTGGEWRDAITALWQQAFSAAEIEERKEIVNLYDNHTNAQKLSALWTHYQ